MSANRLAISCFLALLSAGIARADIRINGQSPDVAASAPVRSVNTQTGVVVLDTDDIGEGTNNLYFTDGRVGSNATVIALSTGKVDVAVFITNNVSIRDAIDLKANLAGGNDFVGRQNVAGDVIVSSNLAVQGVGMSQQDDGFYVGSVRVDPSQWQLDDVGVSWVAVGPTQDWYQAGISADGRYVTFGGQYSNAWRSADYGQTWTEISFPIERDWTGCGMSADGRRQTLVCNNIPAGAGAIFISTNYGVSWATSGTTGLWYDTCGVSADARYQTASVYNDLLRRSDDYGQTWTNVGSTINNTHCMQLSISSDGRYQTAVYSGQPIYRSDDYGLTWSTADLSRWWYGVQVSDSGKEQVAVVHQGQIYLSDDYGLTWYAVVSNRDWMAVSMSKNGQYISAFDTAHIFRSEDYGVSWTSNTFPAWVYTAVMSADANVQVAGDYDSGRIYVSHAELTARADVDVTIPVTPAYTNSPASKQYVDDEVTAAGTGKVDVTVYDAATQALDSAMFKHDGSVAMSGNIELDGNWLSGDGGDEGVFVTSDGKVGIGTNNPAQKLDVNGTTIFRDDISVNASGTIDVASQTLPLGTVHATNFNMVGSGLTHNGEPVFQTVGTNLYLQNIIVSNVTIIVNQAATNSDNLVSYSNMQTYVQQEVAQGSVSNAALLNNQAGSYYLGRGNHTGTQLASTISDFDSSVAANTTVASNTTARTVLTTGKVDVVTYDTGTNTIHILSTNEAYTAMATYVDNLVVGSGRMYMTESGPTSILFHVTSGFHTNKIGEFYNP